MPGNLELFETTQFRVSDFPAFGAPPPLPGARGGSYEQKYKRPASASYQSNKNNGNAYTFPGDIFPGGNESISRGKSRKKK